MLIACMPVTTPSTRFFYVFSIVAFTINGLGNGIIVCFDASEIADNTMPSAGLPFS